MGNALEPILRRGAPSANVVANARVAPSVRVPRRARELKHEEVTVPGRHESPATAAFAFRQAIPRPIRDVRGVRARASNGERECRRRNCCCFSHHSSGSRFRIRLRLTVGAPPPGASAASPPRVLNSRSPRRAVAAATRRGSVAEFGRLRRADSRILTLCLQAATTTRMFADRATRMLLRGRPVVHGLALEASRAQTELPPRLSQSPVVTRPAEMNGRGTAELRFRAGTLSRR